MGEAVNWLEEAVRLDPANHKARLKLGAALEATGRFDSAMRTFAAAVHAQHRARRAQSLKPEPEPEPQRSAARSVAIFCDEYGQTWWPKWGPSSLARGGLGGSEEAVVFLSRALAVRGRAAAQAGGGSRGVGGSSGGGGGFTVDVYGDFPAEDLGRDAWGVTWRPLADFDPQAPPSVFVAWRYHISAALALSPALFGLSEAAAVAASASAAASAGPAQAGGSARPRPKVFVWLQDVPPFDTYVPWFTGALDGIFCLSGFHARALPPHAQPLAAVTPNGLDPAFFAAPGANGATAFVYGSSPTRGLDTLLRCWPFIAARLPGATLDVFYGFSAAVVEHGRASMGASAFEAWRAGVEAGLRLPGVRYRGMVDHATLAAAYAAAGFSLYPTVYPETGCVSLMKAMAMGAVPITSRFADSTLPELAGRFDLGPRPLVLGEDPFRAAGNPAGGDPAGGDPAGADRGAGGAGGGLPPGSWAAAYVDAVVEASVRSASAGLDAHRRAMVAHAREKFLWASVAETWEAAFFGP